jgi:maltose/moltooligosaccharide transporter
MFAIYSIVCFIVAFALPWLAKTLTRKGTHALALTLGGLGLLSMNMEKFALLF